MELKRLVTAIRNRRLKDSDDALQAIAESEKYLQQAYEGRYLFELIQNVRDANKEVDTLGSVFIELTAEALVVANTGAPFGKEGVDSITTIGRSPKNSQDFIGFKGIGFKSVLEITIAPRIVTENGTLFFDRTQTQILLKDRALAVENMPIFFIPHYGADTISPEERGDDIVTKIVLPLKPGLDPSRIIERFQEISVYQLLLLGYLKKVSFIGPGTQTHFLIQNNAKSRQTIVTVNEAVYHFRRFAPAEPLPIPAQVIASLDDKERKMYEKSPRVELAFVFDTDDQRQLRKIADASLYLFYPLKMVSGFSFLIHSYFLVDPARTTLRDSPLNVYLLEKIADYLTGEWLQEVKKTDRKHFLDFLAFTRNKDVPLLNHLYDRLVSNLKTKRFVYDEQTRRFFALADIVVADGFDLGLFADHLFQGKRLVYIQTTATREWLIEEMDADYLTYDLIAEHIEAECERQRQAKNLAFFQHLYEYAVAHPKLNLNGHKVLLTRNWELLTSDDGVFYGMSQQVDVIFPNSIQQHIYFIHAEIKIPEQRQGKSHVGYIEYSTELLVRRLLQLYENESVPKFDVLTSLLQLRLSEKLLPQVRQRVLLPVQGETAWVRPFARPVYYPSPQLEALYSKDKFIDLALLAAVGIEREELKERLLAFGAWDMPAIYYVEQRHSVSGKDPRYLFLKAKSNLGGSYFELNGDWQLDVPEHITPWFTTTILQRFQQYLRLVRDEDNPRLKYRSRWSSDHDDLTPADAVKCYSFLQHLRHQPWIRLTEQGELFYASDIVGMDPIDYMQPHTALIRKYLDVLSITFKGNEEFIHLLGMPHLDGHSIGHFKLLFQLVFSRYADLEINGKEFLGFYNKLLSKLFDFYNNFLTNKSEVLVLQQLDWLGYNEQEEVIYWEEAQNIYYIDDKPAYDILPDSVKVLLQPQFTNRDKNRFGQIAKRIGLDPKKTITQTLLAVEVLHESPASRFFPSFAECLALTEVLLDLNLDPWLEDLRKAVVKICPSLTIELHNAGGSLGLVDNISHKIVFDDFYRIYVTKVPKVRKSYFHASVLNDLLVELLERDLQKIRLTFNDFFAQPSVSAFIERYEVSAERVDEIAGKLAGTIYSREQSFWLDILQALHLAPDPLYVADGRVDYTQLAAAIGVSVDELLPAGFDYGRLDAHEHIAPLAALFDALHLTLEEYNATASFPVDFSPYYRRLFESLRYQHKNEFRFVLHQHLVTRDFEAKALFQQLLDSYAGSVEPKFSAPCLLMDIETEFQDCLQTAFPDLGFPAPLGWAERAVLIDELFGRNQRAFKTAIQPLAIDEDFYREFISRLEHRSLLYFEDTLDVLRAIYKEAYGRQGPAAAVVAPGADDPLGLSLYRNPDSLAIEPMSTSLPAGSGGSNGGDGRRYPFGRRLDGSIQSPVLQKIGVVAEKMVYDLLVRRFKQVEWVSSNAARAGCNPEGSDEHGYDLSYLGDDEAVHFVEVKGKNDDQKNFYVTFPEVNTAMREKERYHLYFVPFALDNERRQILDLGNLFLLEGQYDLFHNDRFTATFDTLEIRFV